MKDSGIAWIGEIPADWTLGRIKHHFQIESGSTPKSEIGSYWDGEIPWITPADYKTVDKYVSSGKRSLTIDGYNSCNTTMVPAGSIIFSKRAPIGTVAIAKNELCTNQGCLSCIPSNNVDTTFFYYVMSVFVDQFELLGSGTTFKEISQSAFSNFPLTYPNHSEQQSIAAYLDSKCAEIDTLAQDIQAQIDLLVQYKQSVISEAVTKGLDNSFPMKDSGVIWIREIPAHWKISRIKYEIFPLQRPVMESDEVITCFRDGEVTLRKNRREEGFTFSITEHGYQGVEVGDLVIHGMDAFAGSIGCSDSRGKCTPVVHVCKTTGDNRYFMYFLRNMAYTDVFMDFAEGIRVRSSDFRNFAKLGRFDIVVPPLAEQQAIAAYLDEKCAEIDAIIADKQKQLDTLGEYKKSMIYEYVTGKKEIPA